MQSPFLLSLDVEPLNAKPIPQSTGCRPNLSGTKRQSPILNRLDDEPIPQAPEMQTQSITHKDAKPNPQSLR
ncbi:hypothetical protein BgiMline_022855 [Biomphalaria glabrata]|nr:hypothetical protein BgiMline_010670 [Biomphalaria glabrata]